MPPAATRWPAFIDNISAII
ncbi:hypothetical protein CGLO_18023 [Colletotrichum gloeosporioides Cg-14]|uniref:Uncharacterized protein n=1 Tax=Colletotrichum gloeosporioides (strain Cg-14) TaxID=1237896 RepID=T0KVG9_COLGC|nr:hypothetical protein CGLO_18023 [Colletotrichum gloeosporioides Cg-14]